MPKLTKRFVEGLKPAAKNVLEFDDKLAGFGVRVMTSGRRFYFVRYRNAHGRSRWFTIGEHGKVTADAARAKAHRVFEAVAAGQDPSGEREAFRAAPTVSDLLDRYLAEHVDKRNRPGTRAGVRWIVEKRIRPELGPHKVAAVTRQDLAKLHAALASTPRQANLVLAVCSKAFSLAELWEMRAEGTNPCTRIERNPENHRERFLSADELGRLGTALRQAESDGLPWKGDGQNRTLYPRVTTAAIELLLFTGCRLSEVINLRWDQIDFGEGIITLAETKAGKPQTVMMNAKARQVLKGLDTAARSLWVLPAPSARRRRRPPVGGAPVPSLARDLPLSKTTLESAWTKIRIAAGILDVRLHDLRHTVGTYAGQSGANAFLVRDLLRHKNLAVTGRYVNRSDDPVRTLSDHVGERIAAGLDGRKPAEVVPMKRGA